MSHCQRCGAPNEVTSRFCVTCGAPLASNHPPPMRPAAAPATAVPPPPAAANPHAATWGSPSAPQYPPAPANPLNVSGTGFEYASTAAPPTREEFEARQAAIRASQLQAQGQSPQAEPVAPRVAGYAPGVVPQTAAMPGVPQDPELVPDGAPRMLAGFLVSYDTEPLGRFWPIFQGRNRLGRQGAGVELEIEVDHPTASSRHAMVYASACPGRIKLEDTGSTNGTMVNGTRLVAGTRQELRDGDRVRFGLLSTIVKIV